MAIKEKTAADDDNGSPAVVRRQRSYDFVPTIPKREKSSSSVA
jgi:hypothetical protein